MNIPSALERQPLQVWKGSSNPARNHGRRRSNLLLQGTGAALLIPMENNTALKINIDNNCC